MNTSAGYRTIVVLLTAAIVLGLGSCGDAGRQRPTIAATTATPTPGPVDEPAEADLGAEDEMEPPTAVVCTAPPYRARLDVASLGGGQFRVDLVLEGMGLPVGRFWVVEDGERRHLAGFPDRPEGPPPAAEVLALTSGSMGASVTVEVAAGASLAVMADVHGEIRGVSHHEGRCQEYWHFTTTETDVVLVG